MSRPPGLHEVHPPADLSHVQCEILVPELWSPSSGAIFAGASAALLLCCARSRCGSFTSRACCAAEEGDQQRFWRMTRKYAETLSAETEGTRMKVVRIRACPGRSPSRLPP